MHWWISTPWAEELLWKKAKTTRLEWKRKSILPIHPTCKERLGCPHLTLEPAGSDGSWLPALHTLPSLLTHTRTHPMCGGVGQLVAVGWALLPFPPFLTLNTNRAAVSAATIYREFICSTLGKENKSRQHWKWHFGNLGRKTRSSKS